MHLERMNLKIIFLHNNLDDKIYMDYAKGFSDTRHDIIVSKLKISLYDLKQSQRQW